MFSFATSKLVVILVCTGLQSDVQKQQLTESR